jgi:hypothetical protein
MFENSLSALTPLMGGTNPTTSPTLVSLRAFSEHQRDDRPGFRSKSEPPSSRSLCDRY